MTRAFARFRFKPEDRHSKERMHKELVRRMHRATLVGEAHTKKLLSTGNVAGDNPSPPGEPPHVVTGTLRSSVGREVQSEGIGGLVVGRVGVRRGPADKYARRLELGFAGIDKLGRIYNQAARPYLRRMLFELRDRLRRILLHGKR